MTAQPARDHLPRLTPEHYRGFAFIHWVMTIDRRGTGWLTDVFHARWREAVLHTLIRYDLVCPVYCLMPDHVHMLWLGCSSTADQKLAATFFTRITNSLLSPQRWQRESYDHVLRTDEREHGAFQCVSHYVLENPVRKNLVAHWVDYAYLGAVVPGFPDLDPRRADFWDIFWRTYNGRVEPAIPAP